MKLKFLLTWFAESIIITGTGENQETKLAITNTTLCDPVVTFSAQDNAKLLQKLKAVFKRTFNWKNIN